MAAAQTNDSSAIRRRLVIAEVLAEVGGGPVVADLDTSRPTCYRKKKRQKEKGKQKDAGEKEKKEER
jgi:hypothetical protein